MSTWDAATWAQVVMAGVGLVVALAATAVAWFTYRFSIDSQPIDFSFKRSKRPAPEGVIPMSLVCKSPRAYLHQVWSPQGEGGSADALPVVRMWSSKDPSHSDCPRSFVSQGDVLDFGVNVPEGITSFELVSTASVDKRGRARNVWSEQISVESHSGLTSGGKK